MKTNALIATSFILMGLFSGCDLDNTVPVDELVERKDIVLTRSEMDFIQENYGFAMDLFKKVAEKEKDNSFIVSPLSVTIDLGMVDNGANGETRDEINDVLGYKDGSIDGLNSFCQSMLKQSREIDPSTTLEIANAAIINKNYVPLKDSFTKTVKSVYDAEVLYKDFAKEDIKGLINNWCDKKTHGMIPVLLDQEVGNGSYAHFLNATYFKGIWSNQFKKKDTEKEKVTCEDGSQIKVDMMHQKSGFKMNVFNRGLFRGLVMPYGNNAYRMIVLLPEKDKTLDDIKEVLDSEAWASIKNWMKPGGGAHNEIDVKIPVFETEYKIDLSKTLKEMGIKQAFGDGKADFSGMTDMPVYIERVLHKAKIRVDEQGSEAAVVVDASLLGGMSLTPDEPQIPVYEFHADHPFIYAITEVSTGAIFFIGQYTGK